MRQSANAIKIKRVYDPPASDDGFRILVDRLWPRGLTRASAKLDAWPKEAAPSTELRRWYKHDPERWTEFKKRYKSELVRNPVLNDLRSLVRAHAGKRGEGVTLLYGAKATKLNHAIVLRDALKTTSRTKKPPHTSSHSHANAATK